MKALISILLIISIYLITGCGSYRKSNNSNLNDIVEVYLRGKIEYLYNADSSSVICIGNKKKLEQSYSFFVFSITKNKKVTDTYDHVEEVIWDGLNSVKYYYLYGTVQIGNQRPKYKTINIQY